MRFFRAGREAMQSGDKPIIMLASHGKGKPWSTPPPLPSPPLHISLLSQLLFTPLHSLHCPQEYWIIYRGPGFLAVVSFFWLLCSSPPLPISRQQIIVSLSQSLCVSPFDLSLLTGKGGEGLREEPINTTARNLIYLYIIQYSLIVLLPCRANSNVT